MKINNWHDIPWKQFYQKVFKDQEECVMAYKRGDYSLLYKLQRKIVCSFEARSIAVRRVATNEGSKTPGVDGTLWNSPKDRLNAILELKNVVNNPKGYKASPVKRVYIPKPNSIEKRPLGIPTLIDRAVQAVYHIAVDPVVECQSDDHSYGFRIYRSCGDAISRLRSLLDKEESPRWILDADIAKCFDTISHQFLLEKTLFCDKSVLHQMFTSGILDGGIKLQSERGTPQGGIISPMLCNVALNGLEDAATKAAPSFIKRKSSWGIPAQRSKIHLTRYADDFVCTCSSKELLEKNVYPAISLFLEERGLEFKEAKTQIIEVEKFNFLGFWLQRVKRNPRYNKMSKNKSLLLIRPKKDNILGLRREIRKIVSPQKPLASIIRDLNPKIRGWANYYRISYHSLPIFWSLGHYVWEKMWKWARKRHRRQRAKWIFEKYCDSKKSFSNGERKWSFGVDQNQRLFDISKVTQTKLTPIKTGQNPYTLVGKTYWENRRLKGIEAKFRGEIYRIFNHTCHICGESLHNGEIIELHHKIPVKEGGSWKIENIEPLHRICHKLVTHKIGAYKEF